MRNADHLPSSSSPLAAIFLKKFDENINRLDEFDEIIDCLDGMQTKIAAAQDELTPLLASTWRSSSVPAATIAIAALPTTPTLATSSRRSAATKAEGRGGRAPLGEARRTTDQCCCERDND